MAYNAVAQEEEDEFNPPDRFSNRSESPPPAIHHQTVTAPTVRPPLQSLLDNRAPSNNPLGLFMDQQHEGGTLSTALSAQSIFSRALRPNYEPLEEEDEEEGDADNEDDSTSQPRRLASVSSSAAGSTGRAVRGSLSVHRQRKRPEDLKSASQATSPRVISNVVIPQPVYRSASGRSLPLRHPTPDLHILQGAHMATVENLEKSAEKLSMTSSIEFAIKQLNDDIKRSDSRRSSILNSPIEPPLSRQFSNPSSIVDVNSAARSGGYSPGGFNMVSPRESLANSSSRLRSISKASRISSRPEPELEGRPLDSFVKSSPSVSRTASIEEKEGKGKAPAVSTVPMFAQIDNEPSMRRFEEPEDLGEERPTTSASATTLEQGQNLFSDFDGEYDQSRSRDVSGTGRLEVGPRRVSAGPRPTLTRPKSYIDPSNGQEMKFYPAPVPTMLSLPQKLSKLPSQAVRDKRRSQVMSTIPPAHRSTAIWLPDVLEVDGDAADDDAIQNMEFVPQHQRRSMGGRRSTTDLMHIPPQLRANFYFDLPTATPNIEMKGGSAGETLDSILDASAYAPVTAFTEHPFAGPLGTEVYGTANKRLTKSKSQILETSTLSNEKRTSTFNLFRTRRRSSSEMLESEKVIHRATTMSGALESSGLEVKVKNVDVDENVIDQDPNMDHQLNGDFEQELDDTVYHGLPSTLLGELERRKQEQLRRTRPVWADYPDGAHATLLERDTVAQRVKQLRQQKRVNLAWEVADNVGSEGDDDDDVPLGKLFPHMRFANLERNRPLGLMQKHDLDENEPLSARRDRLLGKTPMVRASTMNVLSPMPHFEGVGQVQSPRDEAENPLPATRPVSGDFTSELLGQFGSGTNANNKIQTSKTPPGEEEETLAQRKKRLQAEATAREKEVGAGADATNVQRPQVKPRHSMADILQAHPAAGASRNSSYNLDRKSSGGLLGLHEQQQQQHRASTMMGNESWLSQAQRPTVGGLKGGMYNDGAGGIVPQQGYVYPYMQAYASPYNQFGQQQMMSFANPYAMNYGHNPWMGMGYPMQTNPLAAFNIPMATAQQPLSQGQVDMVERWRQSVLQP